MAGGGKAKPGRAPAGGKATASRGKALELSAANEEHIRNILKVLGGWQQLRPPPRRAGLPMPSGPAAPPPKRTGNRATDRNAT